MNEEQYDIMSGKDWVFDEKSEEVEEAEDRKYIISEPTLMQLLRAEWLVEMMGQQAFYRVYKETEVDSMAPYFYAEDRLKDFFQYNPKLP